MIFEAREKPILEIFEHLRIQFMKWYGKCHKIDSPETVLENQIIVSNIAKKIQNLISWQAHCYRIVSINKAVYEIFLL